MAGIGRRGGGSGDGRLATSLLRGNLGIALRLDAGSAALVAQFGKERSLVAGRAFLGRSCPVRVVAWFAPAACCAMLVGAVIASTVVFISIGGSNLFPLVVVIGLLLMSGAIFLGMAIGVGLSRRKDGQP
jgi:hypothetical protein